MSKDILKTKSPMISRDREYLFNREQNLELNTYVEWDEVGIEHIVNNREPVKFDAVRSLFNKYSTVYTGERRIWYNTPLIDSPSIRETIKKNSDCSIKNLVDCSRDGSLGSETYDYSDFAYCKHLGKIPNNYMVTLRRFPKGVDDCINLPKGEFIQNSKNDVFQPSLGCMVTWLGTPGNDLENILTYNYNMPYQKKTAELQDINNSPDSNPTIFGGIMAALDPVYRQQVMDGTAGDALINLLPPGMSNLVGRPVYANHLVQRDRNKVYGPVDVIKDTYIRSEEGLQFAQTFTLTFEYELRSYSNINTRQAMLDLLANILAVTYTTGDFWGGDQREIGASQSKAYENLKMLERFSNTTELKNNLLQMASDGVSKIESTVKENGGVVNTLKNMGEGATGILAGLLLNKMRPNKEFVHSLLLGSPIGLWHVTVGNPLNPIMSIGNMIITNTKITHTGPLGLDDFPTGLKVEVTLDRGKGRDKRDIEKLYLHGNDRIYTQLGSEGIVEMYKNARPYKTANKKVDITIKGDNYNVNYNVEGGIDATPTNDDLKAFLRYFGTKNLEYISMASGEISYGSQSRVNTEGSVESNNSIDSGS